MNQENDIRWEQRFSNYRKAFTQLAEFMTLDNPNKYEEQGLIKAFEYTYELAWNTIKDFLVYQGETDIAGSRDAFRKAFSVGLIEDGQGWMNMLQSRNRTSHTYNEVTAREIADEVRSVYFPLFAALEQLLLRRLSDGGSSLVH